MTLWIILALLSAIALAFVVWPLFKHTGRLTMGLAAIIILIVGMSAVMYQQLGKPNVPSGAEGMPDTADVMKSLAERLEENPDDVDGWMLLARSYQNMQQFDDAIAAFEKAVELGQGQDAQSLSGLAIALLGQSGGQMNERASSLLESALQLEPNSQNALFYGGGAAAWRGDTELAADRWEMLLQQNPPPEIQAMLLEKIGEWRGEPVVVEQQPAPPVASDAVISINLSVSDEAKAELPNDARIFVIARDPAQPSPPIAVTPIQLSGLPTRVDMTDRNSMVAGRELSAFAELEIVARVSLSGSPAAKSGDWSGSLIVNTADSSMIDLVIDQRIP